MNRYTLEKLISGKPEKITFFRTRELAEKEAEKHCKQPNTEAIVNSKMRGVWVSKFKHNKPIVRNDKADQFVHPIVK